MALVYAADDRPRILFVEDEASIFEPFSQARCAREGFEPIVGAHGRRGARARARIEPDLVLLDLMLPDGDGRDVCRDAAARVATCRS